MNIDNEKTIFVTTGTVGLIAIADIDTNFVKDTRGAPNEITTAETRNGGDIGEKNGSKAGVHNLDTV